MSGSQELLFCEGDQLVRFIIPKPQLKLLGQPSPGAAGLAPHPAWPGTGPGKLCTSVLLLLGGFAATGKLK